MEKPTKLSAPKREIAPPKPPRPCDNCKSTSWWWRSGLIGAGPGAWVCGTCHPCPDPANYKEPVILAQEKKPAALQGTNFYPAIPQEAKSKADSALAVRRDAAGGEDSPDEVLEALKRRLAAGNLKLIKAWEQICDLPEEEFEPLFEQWRAASHKVQDMIVQIHALGFADCLYIENGVKTRKCTAKNGEFICWGCPSEHAYWDEELFERHTEKGVLWESTAGTKASAGSLM